jgi:hypothetical protein
MRYGLVASTYPHRRKMVLRPVYLWNTVFSFLLTMTYRKWRVARDIFPKLKVPILTLFLEAASSLDAQAIPP